MSHKEIIALNVPALCGDGHFIALREKDETNLKY
jgi:hypothetical protein